MTCPWVTKSRLATFGRRVVITSAVFGLTTIGGTGAALATSGPMAAGPMAAGPIGRSPELKVVKYAPTAVSVTFAEPLRSGGARMRVLTDDGDVGIGKVSTGQKTLRRELRDGAPPGPYRVEWKVVTTKGRKLSGVFAFQAANGNTATESSSPVPSPRAPSPSPSSAPDFTRLPSTRPNAAAGPTAVVEQTRGADAAPSVTPDWINGSDPLWTPQPSTTGAVTAARPGDAGQDLGTGFTAVPLTVGGLLVLAAGLVSLFNKPRARG